MDKLKECFKHLNEAREALMTIAVSLLVFVFVIQLAELWCELSVGITEEEAEDER